MPQSLYGANAAKSRTSKDVPLEGQVDEANRPRAKYRVDSPLSTRALEEYYWEGAACPQPDQPGVVRFLPPHPRRRQEEVEEEAEEEGRQVIVPPFLQEGDIRVIPPAEAGRCFALYQRTFGCKMVIRPRRLFGKEEHNYFGHLVKTRKGTWLLIVDCDAYGQAAYIFLIDPNDPLRYVLDVQLPRSELIRILSQRQGAILPEDKARTFIGREVHGATFEDRMQRCRQEK